MGSHSLRRSGWIRGVLITYGVAAFSWLFSSSLPIEDGAGTATNNALISVVIGLGLQLLLLVLRVAVRRYENAHGLQDQLYPQALFVFELLADGVTVLLFAVATFGAIARIPAGV